MIDTPTPERPSYGPVGGGAPFDPAPQAAPARTRRRSSLPLLLAAAAVAFAVGLVANPWFEREVRTRLLGASAPVSAERRLDMHEERLDALRGRVEALEQQARAPRPLPDVPASLAGRPGTDAERLARLEARVDAIFQAQLSADQRLDNLAADVGGLQVRVSETTERVNEAVTGAASGAAQAHGILLLTAARRAVEAGLPLGPLEAGLRIRFADQPALVDAVAAAGRIPSTLAALRADFSRLAPALGSGAARTSESWWERLTTSLGSIVHVRRAGSLDPVDPAARVAAADRALAAGDLARAVAIIERLPDAASASAGWLARARTHLRALQALDRLETQIFAAPPAAVAAPVPPAAAAPPTQVPPAAAAPPTQVPPAAAAPPT